MLRGAWRWLWVVLAILLVVVCVWVVRDRRKMNHALRRTELAEKQDVVAHVVADVPDAPPPKEDPGLAARLAALGYTDGLVEADDGPTSVTIHKQGRTDGGWNFYTVGGRSSAMLVDMDGREVWRWDVTLKDVWPDFSGDRASEIASWRRALLLPGGDVIGVWSDYGIARVDRYGRVRWAHFMPVHHDLELLPDGGVVTLIHEPRRVKKINPRDDVFEDFLVWLGPDGAEQRRISVLKAFADHPDFPKIWGGRGGADVIDPFHTNSVQVVDERLVYDGGPFKSGQILTSMRNISTVAVIDPETEAVVWYLRGDFRSQHDPRIVGPNEVLVFDNRGLGKRSRVLAYDTRNGRPGWSYTGTEAAPFYTIDCGHAQRLANGNTLINESASGRAFEVEPDGKIVWEYRSPYQVPDDDGKGQMIARFYEFRRVPADTDMSWMVRPQ